MERSTAANGFRLGLDVHSGVPVYRQIIDQVLGGVASGAFRPGDQLPTVRQLAVDLAINPNTVVRAYRELEIRGVIETHQGTGTFISRQEVKQDAVERQRRLTQLVRDFVARGARDGFTVQEMSNELKEFSEQRR